VHGHARRHHRALRDHGHGWVDTGSYAHADTDADADSHTYADAHACSSRR
jgi:hypothetical protein